MSQNVNKPIGKTEGDNKPRHHLRSKNRSNPNAKRTGDKRKPRKNTLEDRSKVYRANLRAFNECREAWPNVFNLSRIKPFMVGIRQQLLEDAKARGLNITGGKLYNAIYWVTSTYEYQLSLCKYKVRFDINGNEVGEVTLEQRTNAQLALKNLSPRANKVVEIKRRKQQEHRRQTAAKEMGEEPKQRPQRTGRPTQARKPMMHRTGGAGRHNSQASAAAATPSA